MKERGEKVEVLVNVGLLPGVDRPTQTASFPHHPRYPANRSIRNATNTFTFADR